MSRWSKGALEAGVPAEQPFDVILAEGRVEEVPQAWLDQLAEGGRLVAVVGEADMAQACIYTSRARPWPCARCSMPRWRHCRD